MASLQKLQQWSLRFALLVAALLLVRFAWDFTSEMSFYLAAPFWMLVAVALSTCWANLFWQRRENPAATSLWERRLLLAAIPLGFVASSLDCTGLSLQGCSRFCTFIKTAWIPLIAIASFIYYLAARRQPMKSPAVERTLAPSVNVLTLSLLIMSAVPLWPHCVCYNAGNGWWIGLVGASPTCYAWAFMVSLISLSALRAGARTKLSIATCGLIIGGGLAFFVGHYFFHFPW